MDKEKHHVQLPNNMTISAELTPKDLLIYVSIKRHMNAKSLEAYPSMETIAAHASSTKPTVKKCIDKLISLGYITIRKEGRKNVYTFSKHKNFEPLSYDFLEKQDLSANEKAYLLATQQFMFKDLEGYGKVTFTDNKLSKIINMSYNSIIKYNTSLKEKGYLTIADCNSTEQGLQVGEKLFHLNEYDQAIVFTLQNHEDRLDYLEKQNKELTKQLEILLKEKQIKEKQEDTDNSTIIL